MKRCCSRQKKTSRIQKKKSKEFFNILKRRGLQKALQSICGPQATNFYLSVVFLSETKTLEIQCIPKEFENQNVLKWPKPKKTRQPMLYLIFKYEMWFLLCLPSNSQYKKIVCRQGLRKYCSFTLFTQCWAVLN